MLPLNPVGPFRRHPSGSALEGTLDHPHLRLCDPHVQEVAAGAGRNDLGSCRANSRHSPLGVVGSGEFAQRVLAREEQDVFRWIVLGSEDASRLLSFWRGGSCWRRDGHWSRTRCRYHLAVPALADLRDDSAEQQCRNERPTSSGRELRLLRHLSRALQGLSCSGSCASYQHISGDFTGWN